MPIKHRSGLSGGPEAIELMFSKNWFDTPNKIFSPDLPLDPYARLAYCYLMRWDANKKPKQLLDGYSQMAKDTAMSERTCMRAITNLEAAGLLICKRQKGSPNLYQVYHPEDPDNRVRAAAWEVEHGRGQTRSTTYATDPQSPTTYSGDSQSVVTDSHLIAAPPPGDPDGVGGIPPSRPTTYATDPQSPTTYSDDSQSVVPQSHLGTALPSPAGAPPSPPPLPESHHSQAPNPAAASLSGRTKMSGRNKVKPNNNTHVVVGSIPDDLEDHLSAEQTAVYQGMLALGVTDTAARALVNRYSLAQCRAVLQKVADAKPGEVLNPPGFVTSALEENWSFGPKGDYSPRPAPTYYKATCPACGSESAYVGQPIRIVTCDYCHTDFETTGEVFGTTS